jgi:hypothetical protein
VILPDLSDKTVFLLGGGPSLTESLNELEETLGDKEARKRWIIAINESIYCALYADLLFFRDISWYFANKKVVDAWSGIVVTTAKSPFYSEKVQVVDMRHCRDFLIGGDEIKHGRSSGHIALSLAIYLGARRCVLLGYECRLVQDFETGQSRSHFHDRYSTKAIELTYKEYFLPAWQGWGDAARRAGVEVVNATPDSAIIDFPFRPLHEVLSE